MLSCARAPPETIQLLLKMCPDSVKIADRSGTYPLHFVCSWKVGAAAEEQGNCELRKVLELLLEFGPEVLNMRNQWGQTPLHCIFDNDAMPSVETIKALLGLSAASSSTEEESADADTHDDGASKDSTKKLKRYALHALGTQDSNSFLPLHLAAAKGAPEEILRLLISAYPKAAMTATASGDLPIHFLQYHAEDTAKESMDGPMMRQGSWRGDSGIFRLKKNKTFDVVTLKQVESLLEPLCLSNDMNSRWVNPKKGEDDDMVDDDDAVDQSTLGGISTSSSFVDPSVAINLAMRLPGSRNVNLPIHIAAEHGVSFDILKALCEQNPEGAATPQPITKSMLASTCSSLSATEHRYKSPEMFPIESFEIGRAAVEAHNLLDRFGEPSSDQAGIEKARAALNSFEDRSDLLFAFYPDAVPSVFRESKRNIITSLKLPFRKEPKRLERLEQRIRSEAMDTSSDSFSLVARRAWLWLYRGINGEDGDDSMQYQGSVGRIVTGLSRAALLKLSFISHIANDLGVFLEEDIENLRDVPCLIQGKSIIQFAEARAANMTLSSILVLNESEKSNFVHTICECLDANDALAFSSVCLRTMRSGVRLLPENKVKETGRSWNLPARKDLTGPGLTEFWQHLDSKLMLLQSTHTIFVSYYLEVSESFDSGILKTHKKLSDAHFNGGLLVTSEDASSTEKTEDCIEGQTQRKLVYSSLSPISGYEVQLSFTAKPGRSYSLRVYGPEGGGRVSVSNARLRQVRRNTDVVFISIRMLVLTCLHPITGCALLGSSKKDALASSFVA